jgi:hypothetical protein
MALVLADRVKETTTTAGTGTVTLLGASTGFQSFAAVGNANTTYYTIAGQTTSEWEVGIGTYTSAGTTLARTTVLANSAGTQPTALTFSAGTKDVFVTYPAGKSVNYDAADLLTVSDAAFTLQDNTDATKQAQFELSGITTATTRTYTLPNLTGSLATTGTLTQTFSGVTTFSNNVTFSGNNTLNLGTAQTSGVITIGGTSGTGNFVLGRSTVSQTTSIQAGATASGSTKTINFGTGGLTGSTTTMAIGSTFGTTVTANGVWSFSTYANIEALLETATITASAPAATTNFDVITQAVQYYTTNASANFTFNIRGDSTTTLNTIMAVGQSCTIALLVTNGSTAYYPTAFQVDGSSVTPKWQGGTAPTAGNASALDVYVFTVIKTASATFTVLASQTKFA